jgi:hypothetical protein
MILAILCSRGSWSKPQVEARAHPGVLKASVWLNELFHVRNGKRLDGVDLKIPLTYADRYRIRRPGVQWDAHPPHVDGKCRKSAAGPL